MEQDLLLESHSGITSEQLKRSKYVDNSGAMMDVYVKHISNPDSPMCWGAGDPSTAKLVFVGEAPGAQEMVNGIVFSGPAGQCLSGVLSSAGIDRARDCYLINTVLTAPIDYTTYSGIGKPTIRDLVENRERVIDVIKTIKPKAVVCLGAYAYMPVLLIDALKEAIANNVDYPVTKVAMSKVRGWSMLKAEYDIPTFVTYHPSYILRLYSKEKRDPNIKQYLEDFRNIKKAIK